MSDFYSSMYNPDVLTCLANLSNDEVFTPPEVANRMLDMLPEELWHDSSATFLDPACKSGVFLREIAKRLIEGLKEKIPDLQERIDHIFHKQLYGIAITELTSLLSRRSVYCSKYPNSKYSITLFEDTSGNIRYKRIPHRWQNGKCLFCGASKSEYERGDELETHAYEWIHTIKPEEIFKMKFDVIISNPPYQLSDGGNGKSAKPIYQLFVEQAKKLRPRYMTMIIPSRWFSGGKGLDDFRKTMLSDRHIRKLVDYENFKDVFPGVDLAGGASYFLWDRDNMGICEVVNFNQNTPTCVNRYLDEYEIFIRQNLAVEIVRKVQENATEKRTLSDRVSSRKPFGLLVPKAPIAGQTDFSKPVGFYYDGNTRIAKPGECCTESWIVAGAFDTEEEVLAYKSYIFTKIVRFLLLQTVVSQDVTKKNFCFIPDLETYQGQYTDKMLCEMWGISEKEWSYIDSRIATIGGDDNGN